MSSFLWLIMGHLVWASIPWAESLNTWAVLLCSGIWPHDFPPLALGSDEMVLGQSSENSTQCSREKAPGACYIGAGTSWASLQAQKVYGKSPVWGCLQKLWSRWAIMSPRRPRGLLGSPRKPGCWAVAAISSDILDPTKEPDEKSGGWSTWVKSNFKIMNESSSAFTSSPNYKIVFFCRLRTGFKSFFSLHSWLDSLISFCGNLLKSKRLWETQNSRLNDEENVRPRGNTHTHMHHFFFLNTPLLLYWEEAGHLGKDTPESLQENGLLFLWACFFGYSNLHIWKNWKSN